MIFQSLQRAFSRLLIGVSAILVTLFLGGCIQESDFEKFKPKKIDGWSYVESKNLEGHINSSSSNFLKPDLSDTRVYIAFECNNSTNLHLLIETFSKDIHQALPVKMRYAKSAFGRFTVVDVKAINHQSKFTIVAQGSNQNTVSINLHPGELKLSQKLISPDLTLTIPALHAPTELTIQLANPNIKRVLKDCGYKPAFMMSD